MAERKIQSRLRYFLAFLIGTIIFIDIFVIAYSLSYGEFRRISNIQEELSYEIFRNKLRYSLFEEDICSADLQKKVTEDLGYQGKIIDYLERKLGKNNEEVLFSKQFYTLIELEHFDFVRKINRECNSSIPTILFFYSNGGGEVEESEDLGNLLASVYNRNPEVIIYSFDINLKSDLIEDLKKKYYIQEPLTIVINEKTKMVKPISISEVEKNL